MGEMKRYYMEYNGFDECVDERECDSGSWVEFSDVEAALAERDKRIKELLKEIRLLKACIFSCLQSDDYYYIKERMELEESRWDSHESLSAPTALESSIKELEAQVQSQN